MPGAGNHPDVPAYSTAKHALTGLHRSAARGYPNVRINLICPGYISTPLLERRLDADRKAALASWLAGPEAGFVTGALYTVDGGFTA